MTSECFVAMALSVIAGLSLSSSGVVPNVERIGRIIHRAVGLLPHQASAVSIYLFTGIGLFLCSPVRLAILPRASSINHNAGRMERQGFQEIMRGMQVCVIPG